MMKKMKMQSFSIGTKKVKEVDMENQTMEEEVVIINQMKNQEDLHQNKRKKQEKKPLKMLLIYLNAIPMISVSFVAKTLFTMLWVNVDIIPFVGTAA